MKIGVDIDDTLTNSMDALNAFLKHSRNWNYSRKDYHTQYWPAVWKLPVDAVHAIDLEFKDSHFFLNLEPIKDSLHILHELAKEHEIIFITSRPPSCEKQTREWLAKHCQFNYTLYFSGDPNYNSAGLSKGELCNKLNIPVFIDDQDKYAEDCIKHNVVALLHDAPWNKSYNNSSVIRFLSWLEIPKIIEKINSK